MELREGSVTFLITNQMTSFTAHRNPLSPPTVLYHIHHPPLALGSLARLFLFSEHNQSTEQGRGSCSLTLSYTQRILSCQLSVGFYASLSYVTHGAKEPLCFTN